MRILNAAEMREADRRTIEEIGIPSRVLMETAGREVVAAMEGAFGDLPDLEVAVLSGRGSNGGDGFVAARALHERGVDVVVYLLGRTAEVRGDARATLEAAERVGVEIVEIATEQDWDLHHDAVCGSDVIVDAIVGTGLRDPLTGLPLRAVRAVNESGTPVVSIDLPSGLSADSAEPIGEAIDAVMTVTLGAPKIPLMMPPALALAGTIVVADIGIPSQVIDGLDAPIAELIVPDTVRDLVPPRPSGAHKGSFGHVLIVAGSLGKTGAAHLAALGALRSGAGLVTVATPRACLPIVAALGTEFMTEGLGPPHSELVDAAAVDRVIELAGDVLAVGPGLGRGPGPTAFVRGLLERSEKPIVIDADGLNALEGHLAVLRGREGREVIVTPHPGEMARLLGSSTATVQADRLDSARRLAADHQVYVVLKGQRTLVASPDGHVYVNPTGNPGMATGGTGDVLTGTIAAWLAQLRDPEGACAVGVYLHGLAGDLAAAETGDVAMIATDLAAKLGDAVGRLRAHGSAADRPSASE